MPEDSIVDASNPCGLACYRLDVLELGTDGSESFEPLGSGHGSYLTE